MSLLRMMAQCADGAAKVAAGYTAKAVHFDGTATLNIASLTATDNGLFSFAVWTKLVAGDTNTAGFYAVDTEGTYDNDGGLAVNNAFVWDTSNESGSARVNMVTPDNSYPVDQWSFLIGSVDTTSGIMKVYNGDTDISVVPYVNNSPFNMAFSGKSFWHMGDGYAGDQVVGDIADARFMPGVSLLVAGDIPLATRRLFIDGSGKPVAPATATASLGTPAILFSGDHTTFPINQGNGGAFTLTGALTNASTHP